MTPTEGSCALPCPIFVRPTPLLNLETNGVDEDTFNSMAFYVWRAWQTDCVTSYLSFLLLDVLKVWSQRSTENQAGRAYDAFSQFWFDAQVQSFSKWLILTARYNMI